MTESLFEPELDAITGKVEEARKVLADLGFDKERSNERSALVLLTLLGLAPDMPWSKATSPMLRTEQIMEWLRAHWNKNYKPNTRETIRRRTLHQFVDHALVEQNPDDPARSVNSPNNCYQISAYALELLRTLEEPGLEARINAYREKAPGLVEEYARAREMQRIPVTLPSGKALTLSPKGQNPLIKQMIESFCPRFAPGGHVLYIGDADSKWAVFEEKALANLGVTGIDPHGIMPDLVVYMPDKNWLLLMEAVTSHGPVNAKRHRDLAALFSDSSAGLIYVTCFLTRKAMAKFVDDIAWETEAWCADHETHLIHFDGKRFLGPYDADDEDGNHTNAQ